MQWPGFMPYWGNTVMKGIGFAFAHQSVLQKAVQVLQSNSDAEGD